jgi:hypothetical protein
VVFSVHDLNLPFFTLWQYSSETSAARVSGGQVFLTAPGTYRLMVQASVPSGSSFRSLPYSFSVETRYVGPRIDPGKFNPAPNPGFAWLDPNGGLGARRGSLTELADYYAFENVGKFKSIDFWGSDLDVELLDAGGASLRASTPIANPQIPNLRRLDCQGLRSGDFYVVRVKRPAGVDSGFPVSFWMQLGNQ